MKYIIILLSLFLSKCGSSSQDKGNRHERNINYAFNLLKNNKVGEFKKEANNFSKEQLVTIIEDRILLMLAVEKGYEDIVSSLIRKWVDVNKDNLELETALYFAFKIGNEKVKKLLIDNKAYYTSKILELNLNQEIKEQIQEAIEENNVLIRRLFHRIFKDGGKVQTQAYSHIDKQEEDLEAEISKLVKMGINLNMKNKDGSFILLDYFYNSQGLKAFLDYSDLLIKYGLDLNLSFKNFSDNSKNLLTFLIEVIIKSENSKKDLEEKYEKKLVTLIKNPKLNSYTLSHAFEALLYYVESNDKLDDSTYLKIRDVFLSNEVSLNINSNLIKIILDIITGNKEEQLYLEYKNIFLNLVKKGENVNLKDSYTYKSYNEEDKYIPLIFFALETKDLDIIKEFLKRVPKAVNMKNPLRDKVVAF